VSHELTTGEGNRWLAARCNCALLLLASALLAACGGGGSEGGGGGSASLPSTSTTGANAVTLTWDAVTDLSLRGYRIYYGTGPGTYLQGLDVGNVTSHTVTGLTSGTRYYFAATAYDVAGNESDFSRETFKDVP
jgi:hypothetical protein